jgi:hypothetical protein
MSEPVDSLGVNLTRPGDGRSGAPDVPARDADCLFQPAGVIGGQVYVIRALVRSCACKQREKGTENGQGSCFPGVRRDVRLVWS